MVANSSGGIWDDERHEWVAPLARGEGAPGPVAGANTTIGVVVTDAELTREQANRVAAVAHDGLARAVRPAHTRFDGDTIFCLATGAVAVPPGAAGATPFPDLAYLVEVAATQAVARAIAEGVREGGRRAR
jgi:L-aminopeptidase/D-esterase-like protein